MHWGIVMLKQEMTGLIPFIVWPSLFSLVFSLRGPSQAASDSPVFNCLMLFKLVDIYHKNENVHLKAAQENCENTGGCISLSVQHIKAPHLQVRPPPKDGSICSGSKPCSRDLLLYSFPACSPGTMRSLSHPRSHPGVITREPKTTKPL